MLFRSCDLKDIIFMVLSLRIWGKQELGMLFGILKVMFWLLCQKCIPNSPSIATLELLAPRKPAMFVQKVGIGSSIFEGDYEVVIKVLNRGN